MEKLRMEPERTAETKPGSCDDPIVPGTILMSRENPDGQKLEELLQQLINEMQLKTLNLLNDCKDGILRLRIIENNHQIINALILCRHLQLETLNMLETTLGKDKGPENPRI